MSPRRDGGPDRNPQLTVVAIIFGGAGILALIVAVVATQAAVAVFGVIALVIGAASYGAQRVRERSAIETEQTLGGGQAMSSMERSTPRRTPSDPIRDRRPAAASDWSDEEHEEPEPTISEEDDGTGARPGTQAAANVGAATAADPDVDPTTGRSFGEVTPDDDEEIRPPEDDDAESARTTSGGGDDEPGPSARGTTTGPGDDDDPVAGGGRVDLTVRRGGADDVQDAELVDDDRTETDRTGTERGAEARSGDGAG